VTLRRIALLAILAAGAGCVPPAWLPAPRTFVPEGSGFEVALPPGWMQLNGTKDGFLITRDGTALQRIVVRSSEVGKPIGLGAGKRVVERGMSPAELAELVVDDIRATEAFTALQVIESAPAPVAGLSGFRVVAAYHEPAGLPRRIALYGLVDGERFYLAFYIAPERHYFAKDLPVFEELARTFRIRTAVAAPARRP
jgi:hypothetical protein